MMKVLEVVGRMDMGGTETFLLNIFRRTDPKKVKMDFLAYGEKRGFYDDEIEALGGTILHTPLRSTNPMKMVRELAKIMKDGKYDCVHSHVSHNSGWVLLAAKRAGVPVRLAHSHTTVYGRGGSLINRIYTGFMSCLIRKNATGLCACSKKAAQYLYGEKAAERFVFVPNAVDFSAFLSCKTDLAELRKSFGIAEDTLIVGHVGRFGRAKNHGFLIDVFQKLHEKNNNSVLLLAGGGDENVILQTKQKVDAYGLNDCVHFLGIRKDVPALMHLFDVFAFPSVFEGLGIVLLEAQATGLHCVVSEAIQPEADLHIGLLRRQKLSDGAEIWANAVLSEAKRNKVLPVESQAAITACGYQLDECVKVFYSLYQVS